LAALIAPSPLVNLQTTPLGRGLVLSSPTASPGDILLNIECASGNTLMVADQIDDQQQGCVMGLEAIQTWQLLHGDMPHLLVDFLTSSQANWTARLAAFFLYAHQQQKKGGIWSMYANLLPTEDEMSCLMNYTPIEAALLQDPRAVIMARSERNQIQSTHDFWFDHRSGQLKQLKLCSSSLDASSSNYNSNSNIDVSEGADKTRWAICMLNSRCFSETIHAEKVSIMAPCADMLNHSSSNNPNAKFQYNPVHDSFQIIATEDILQGQEVLISYGCVRKNNLEMMRDYGFCMEANLNDRIEFQIGLGGRYDDMYSQLMMSGTTGIAENNDSNMKKAYYINGPQFLSCCLGIPVPSNGDLSQLAAGADEGTRRKLVTVLSLQEASVLQWQQGSSSSSSSSSNGYSSSRSLERDTVDILKKQCIDMLSSMGTTLESDEEELQKWGRVEDASLDRGLVEINRQREMQALRYRMERKRVLKAVLDHLGRYSKMLG
jgi:hypothetical protein